jgi:hypothetical protein
MEISSSFWLLPCGYKYYDLLIQSQPYAQRALSVALANGSIEDIHKGASKQTVTPLAYHGANGVFGPGIFVAEFVGPFPNR